MSGESIRLLSPDEAIARGDELADLWAEVFAAPPYSEPPGAPEEFRTNRLPRHAQREGFRIVVAEGDGLLGFAYGMTGRSDGWWTEFVRSRVGELADEWIPESFEFAELLVKDSARGLGLGRRLASALLDGRSEARVVCQTLDAETPARALYRSLGFRDLAVFDGQVLLGRELRP